MTNLPDDAASCYTASGAAPSSSFSLMAVLSDWELWACANEQVKQHGQDASIFAAMRADELLKQGDQDGVRTWLLIIDRIEQLLAKPAGALH